VIVNLILWLIVGAAAGWLAGYIINKNTALNFMDLVVGIVGALLGGFLSSVIFQTDMNIFSIWGFVMATLGALVVAFVYKRVAKKSSN
jgi:uncharacterized membrane protein YeaQ/YmgE (transglycosylase-associated protein family)